MKPFTSFGLAGVCLLAGFSIPKLEEAAFAFTWVGFGPAVVFALVLIRIARRSLSKRQIAAVAVVSMLAYGAGAFFYVQMQHRLYLPTPAMLSPAVGAGVLLAGLVGIKGRSSGALGPVTLGSSLSLASVIPLWISSVVVSGGYFWWGVHIALWYVVVGPFAVKILTPGGSRPADEPNKAPEPTPTSVMPAAKQPSRRP